MTIHVETLREVAVFSDMEPRNGWGFSLRDTNVVNDYLTVDYPASISDDAVVTDNYVTDVPLLLHDAAVLRGEAVPSNTSILTMRERATFNDRTVVGSETTLHESAAVTESTAEEIVMQVLHDTATLGDATSRRVRIVRAIRDTSRVFGEAVFDVGSTARDVAVLDDAYTTSVRISPLIHEQAVVTGASVEVLSSVQTVRDAAVLNDSSSISLAIVNVARDEAWIDGYAVPPSVNRAYTAHVGVWAMSEYRAYAVDSIANDYVSTPDGLHTKSTMPIEGFWETGFLDFGTAASKRVDAVMAAGRFSSGLTLTVTADRNSVRESYDYPHEWVSADDVRNSRFRVGKGLHGRYFKFKFSSVDDLFINAATADVATTSRRL